MHDSTNVRFGIKIRNFHVDCIDFPAIIPIQSTDWGRFYRIKYYDTTALIVRKLRT